LFYPKGAEFESRVMNEIFTLVKRGYRTLDWQTNLVKEENLISKSRKGRPNLASCSYSNKRGSHQSKMASQLGFSAITSRVSNFFTFRIYEIYKGKYWFHSKNFENFFLLKTWKRDKREKSNNFFPSVTRRRREQNIFTRLQPRP
jgi:hypothetical protein